jgi:RES domain-containing protein
MTEPPDRDLLEIVDGLPRMPLSTEAYWYIAPGYSARGGEGARIQGGRWNPPQSFPTLYLVLERECAVAEFYRFAERSGRPPEDLLPRALYRYEIELSSVLDLRDENVMASVGVTSHVLRSDDPSRCQLVGDAAHYLSFEGLLAPSATGVGHALAVFTDRLLAGSMTEPLNSELWETVPERPSR